MKIKSKYTLLAGIAVFALISSASYMNLAAAGEHGHAEAETEESHDDHGDEADGHGHDHGAEEGHEEGVLKLSPEQISASGVKLAVVRQGSLSRRISVPGRLVVASDRMGQIAPRVSGIVVEARKNLGDAVEKGEILALIESPEMAEAAAEYQAAQRSAELARTTYAREKTLWEKKVTAEQDYLAARNTSQEAQIRLDLAKQRMQAFGGMGDKASRYHELKSPLDGVVVERELTLGEFVDTSRKAFTVADLSVLWVETAITPDDLPSIEEGQEAVIEGNGKQDEGKLVFVSPVINSDTRSAKAIVELPNENGKWRAGDYVNASITTGTQDAGLVIPQSAIQAIEGKNVVFIETEKGFEQRAVVTGKKDGQDIEVTSGLKAGEKVAAGNTFVLKAEAGKSEAEHSH